MESCWQEDPLTYGERAKVNKPQEKEPPPSQRALGKKKIKKKKKKAPHEDEKKPSKSKKHSVFLTSPEVLHLCSNETTDNDPRKEPAARTTHHLLSSTTNFSLLNEGNSDQCNESLRWNGILDDPVAEEERLWHYRLNRRKRYGAYIQQSLPPEPTLTLKHLPQLCKVAHLNGDHLFCKTELATSSSQNSKT